MGIQVESKLTAYESNAGTLAAGAVLVSFPHNYWTVRAQASVVIPALQDRDHFTSD